MHVHDRSPLQLITTIRTPENLELAYVLAGAGSRSAAFLMDWLLLAFCAQILANLFIVILALPLGEEWGVAISGMLVFGIVNSYFILFEWLMNGQTPGKRLVGIRVIKQGGYALRFLDVLLRNVMRVIDFLPAFYGFGLISLILTKRCQRLGDLVARTLVVQQDSLQTDDLLPQIPTALGDEPQLAATRLSAVPRQVIDLAVEFFASRDQLTPRFRQQIAAELSDLVSRTGGLQSEIGHSTESFLAAVIRQSGQIPTSASGWDSATQLPS